MSKQDAPVVGLFDHLALAALLGDLERLEAAADEAEAVIAAHARAHCRLVRKHGDVARTRRLLGRAEDGREQT